MLQTVVIDILTFSVGHIVFDPFVTVAALSIPSKTSKTSLEQDYSKEKSSLEGDVKCNR